MTGIHQRTKIAHPIKTHHLAAPTLSSPKDFRPVRGTESIVVGNVATQLGSILRHLFLARRQVRAAAVRHFCRHADAFAERGVWVDGFADVHSVCAHLDGQSDLANHVARMRAHHDAAQDLAVAPIRVHLG